jgi:hypothetical protein
MAGLLFLPAVNMEAQRKVGNDIEFGSSRVERQSWAQVDAQAEIPGIITLYAPNRAYGHKLVTFPVIPEISVISINRVQGFYSNEID